MADDLERTDGRVLEALADMDVGDWLRANDIAADAFNEVANAAATIDAAGGENGGESRVRIAALGLMIGFEAGRLALGNSSGSTGALGG
jgi:hypothetical protein